MVLELRGKMHNEKMAEVVRIIGTLEKKFQFMADKQNKLTKKVDETIVRTEEVITAKTTIESFKLA